MSRYTLYGARQSLFTRKLGVALDFYGVDYAFEPKRGSGLEPMLEQRSGTHQIPVLQTPEDWMLADTTPIMLLMDARFPRQRMFPAGISGLIVHLAEEVYDEWIARTMVHYRWHYSESAQVAAEQLSNGDPRAADALRDWGPRACRATGTEQPEQRAAAEAEYKGILAAMQRQLGDTAWLLGERPTAVDCAVLGGLFAHVLNDPDPAKIVRDYPAVVEWARSHEAERLDLETGQALPAEPNGFADYMLSVPAAAYREVLLGNRRALRSGNKAFVVETYGSETSYLTREYPERSSRMIAHRIRHQMGRADRIRAKALLEQYGLDECFLGAEQYQF